MKLKISSGSDAIDYLLKGGFERDIISLIYGPAGSGKTNIVLLTTVNTILKYKKKVIFIDTEGGFSAERIFQLLNYDKSIYESVLKDIILFSPISFQEQKKYIFKTYEIIKKEPDSIGLVVIDSLSMLYRLELGEDMVRSINLELGRQMQILSSISRKYNIPVIVTSQVYTNLEKGQIEIVGGDIPKYWSKCIIELKIIEPSIREAILKKHRALPENRKVKFIIKNNGLFKI